MLYMYNVASVCLPKFLIVGGFVYTGLGARSVVGFEGRGAWLWRHPGSG